MRPSRDAGVCLGREILGGAAAGVVAGTGSAPRGVCCLLCPATYCATRVKHKTAGPGILLPAVTILQRGAVGGSRMHKSGKTGRFDTPRWRHVGARVVWHS